MSHFNSKHFNEMFNSLSPEKQEHYTTIGKLFFTNKMMRTVLTDYEEDNIIKTRIDGSKIEKNKLITTEDTEDTEDTKKNNVIQQKEILKMLKIGYDFDELDDSERELLTKSMGGVDNVKKWIKENC